MSSENYKDLEYLNEELEEPNEPNESMESENISEWLEKVGCNLDEYLENIKVLANKGSASDSVILFGEIDIKRKKTPVAFKIVFKSKIEQSNSLIVEQQIYINVVENLINNLHTPHLTSFIGLVKSCDTDSLLEKLNPVEIRNFKAAMRTIYEEDYDLNNASLLILGKSGGKTFRAYLLEKTLSTSDKFSLLFQIFYTLRCFEKIGLSHNDLHMDNIFVDKLEVPQERIYYISDNKWVKILVQYDVKIYDFDRGSIYHPSVERNFTLDQYFCSEYDQCNKYESRRDLASIFSYFLNASDEKGVRPFFKSSSLISPEFFQRVYNRKFLQLNAFPKGEDEDDLKSGPPITDDQLKSIAVCIDVLLSVPEFIHTSGTGGSEGIVYTLPPAIKSTMWSPTSSISHKSKGCTMSTYPVSTFLTDAYINTINSKMEPYYFKNNIYETEFGKEYLHTSKIILFREFIKRKNVMSNYHIHYLLACYIICIPFIYKFDSNNLIKFINNGKLLSGQQGSILSPYISDIWNVFNGTLPIEMLKV